MLYQDRCREGNENNRTLRHCVHMVRWVIQICKWKEGNLLLCCSVNFTMNADGKKEKKDQKGKPSLHCIIGFII